MILYRKQPIKAQNGNELPDARDYGGPNSQAWLDALEGNPEPLEEKTRWPELDIYHRGLAGTVYDTAKAVADTGRDALKTAGDALEKTANNIYHKGILGTIGSRYTRGVNTATKYLQNTLNDMFE